MTGAKLDALVIWPNAGKVRLKMLTPENLHIHYRPEGSWMDLKVMEVWVRHCLRPYSKKLTTGQRGLLILDNFEGHINDHIQKEINKLGFDVLRLPPNTTAHLQPLDLVVNKPFQDYFNDCWESWISSDDPHPLTKKAHKYEKPSKEKVISWISKSWKSISGDLSAESFDVFRKLNVEILQPLEEDIQEEIDSNIPIIESEEESTDKETDDSLNDHFIPNDYLDYEIEINEQIVTSYFYFVKKIFFDVFL